MKTHRRTVAVVWMIIVVLLLAVCLKWLCADDDANGARKERSPNKEMIKMAEKIVRVKVTPPFQYSFDLMRQGVLQHNDRRYTYDVVPPELVGGFLFQGIHRTPKGTAVEFELRSPAKVYFFYHSTADGGYSKILAKLPNWKRSSVFPQYDIHNGQHGLKMEMYQLEADAGTHSIPASTKDRACFNIVFQPNPDFSIK
ncbi:MAG: hypothetical protein H8M99_13725 [Gloeobacteraceae cyanobacterium ES-bin-144]|nr:hypothetical protein [Verrucomicrobiales bacterium]